MDLPSTHLKSHCRYALTSYMHIGGYIQHHHLSFGYMPRRNIHRFSGVLGCRIGSTLHHNRSSWRRQHHYRIFRRVTSFQVELVLLETEAL